MNKNMEYILVLWPDSQEHYDSSYFASKHRLTN